MAAAGQSESLYVIRERMRTERQLDSPTEIPLLRVLWSCLFFFFFQAEDGIRDLTVTGVQTCALPISVLFQRGAHKLLSCARLKPLTAGAAGTNCTLYFKNWVRARLGESVPTAV